MANFITKQAVRAAERHAKILREEYENQNIDFEELDDTFFTLISRDGDTFKACIGKIGPGKFMLFSFISSELFLNRHLDHVAISLRNLQTYYANLGYTFHKG